MTGTDTSTAQSLLTATLATAGVAASSYNATYQAADAAAGCDGITTPGSYTLTFKYKVRSTGSRVTQVCVLAVVVDSVQLEVDSPASATLWFPCRVCHFTDHQLHRFARYLVHCPTRHDDCGLPSRGCRYGGLGTRVCWCVRLLAMSCSEIRAHAWLFTISQCCVTRRVRRAPMWVLTSA